MGHLEACLVPDVPSAFGEDAFGRRAEAARLFGTPKYIAAQSVAVILWIALNAIAVGLRWDPNPFILLNLAFSTQAAYAAPLILLAQTRQADRDAISAWMGSVNDGRGHASRPGSPPIRLQPP